MKEKTNNGTMLPVMEEFYSLQGEGYNTGEAAYFIRIGGCDVGCHFCDVKESWDASMHPLSYVDHVVENVIKASARSVVITGGEPLLYPMDYLCNCLHQTGIKIFLETSGSASLSGEWDWICLSPKKNAPPLPIYYQKANELKVIIESESDFVMAESHAEKVSAGCKCYLQPEWSKSVDITQPIVEYILKHPKWKISLQTHKFINIP